MKTTPTRGDVKAPLAQLAALYAPTEGERALARLRKAKARCTQLAADYLSGGVQSLEEVRQAYRELDEARAERVALDAKARPE